MKFDLSNKYKAQCAQEKLDDLIKKEKWIEIREIKHKRSIDANALYWLWLTCIKVETGNDMNELHCLYRAKHLQRDEDYILKVIKPDVWEKIKKRIDEFHYFDGLNLIIDLIAESTTRQDTEQFSEYLNKIKRHAKATFNITLLNLEEKNFEEFYRYYGYK